MIKAITIKGRTIELDNSPAEESDSMAPTEPSSPASNEGENEVGEENLLSTSISPILRALLTQETPVFKKVRTDVIGSFLGTQETKPNLKRIVQEYGEFFKKRSADAKNRNGQEREFHAAKIRRILGSE